jgi:hypothetical protein
VKSCPGRIGLDTYSTTLYYLHFHFIVRELLSLGILAQNGISKTAVREKNDYYATDPRAMEDLLQQETFHPDIWEPACGEGNLSEVLKKHGYNVYSTDIIDRGYQSDILDFLKTDKKWNGDIITNPPFKYTTEFVLQGLNALQNSRKLALFLKLGFLSGQRRYKEVYSKFPPYRVYVFTGRRACSKGNDPEGYKNPALDYCWMIWEKGKIGPTDLKWIET